MIYQGYLTSVSALREVQTQNGTLQHGHGVLKSTQKRQEGWIVANPPLLGIGFPTGLFALENHGSFNPCAHTIDDNKSLIGEFSQLIHHSRCARCLNKA